MKEAQVAGVTLTTTLVLATMLQQLTQAHGITLVEQQKTHGEPQEVLTMIFRLTMAVEAEAEAVWAEVEVVRTSVEVSDLALLATDALASSAIKRVTWLAIVLTHQ